MKIKKQTINIFISKPIFFKINKQLAVLIQLTRRRQQLKIIWIALIQSL